MTVELPRVGALLQATLAELVDLAAQARQAQQNVTGPLLARAEEQLDQLAADLRDGIDTVIERAVTLGYSLDARDGTVAMTPVLPALPSGPVSAPDAITEIGRRLAEVADQTRRRIAIAGNLDIASQDLFVELTVALNERWWTFTGRTEE
jgi:starvation-inducible DNA-binding protein